MRDIQTDSRQPAIGADDAPQDSRRDQEGAGLDCLDGPFQLDGVDSRWHTLLLPDRAAVFFPKCITSNLGRPRWTCYHPPTVVDIPPIEYSSTPSMPMQLQPGPHSHVLFTLLPGPDRKRTEQTYCYRLTYRNPVDSEVGCVMTWEVSGGRLTYQIALERDRAGELHLHCTCADAVYRADEEGRQCKHLRGLLAFASPGHAVLDPETAVPPVVLRASRPRGEAA
jgi:hypothetical protein